MQITEESHPSIFKAFQEIDYDNNIINRDNPASDSYFVDDPWRENLPQIEEALRGLTEEELITFCTGEIEAQEGLASRSAGLRYAHVLLNLHFDEWI